MINLREHIGEKFSASIWRTPCEGKIQIQNDRIFLCQNVADGAICDDKLGYKYSYQITDGIIENTGMANGINVRNFKLLPEFENWVLGSILENQNDKTNTMKIAFMSDCIIIGVREKEATPPYTKEELYNLGFRLKGNLQETKSINNFDNLLDYAGYNFICTIFDRKLEGKVQVENNKGYLCQDIFDGASCSDTLGYKYSWGVRLGTKDNFSSACVNEFTLYPPDFQESPPTNVSNAYKDWKTGDRVICIDDSDLVEGAFVEKGRIYTIKGIRTFKSNIIAVFLYEAYNGTEYGSSHFWGYKLERFIKIKE